MDEKSLRRKSLRNISPINRYEASKAVPLRNAGTPDRVLPRGKDPSIHWTGSWVGLIAGMDREARGKILCLCWGSNPYRPVCRQTLY
jgi:hypothetical protein